MYWQESSKKEIMLGYNKYYAILALSYVLNNSKEMVSAL